MPFDLDHDVGSLQNYLAAFLEQYAGALPSESGAVRAIQALQRTMDRTVAEFAERWNTRSSVSLPPELLAQCFEHLPFNARLAVASVSRQWRAMALAAPRLWSTFRITGQERHPGKLLEMLKRSQAAPLEIWLDIPPDDQAANTEANALIPQHSHRLAYIAYRDQGSLLSMPAPRLEEFEALSHAHTIIPEDLCGGRATHLRKVVVYAFVLPPSCPALQNVQDFLGDFADVETLAQLVRLCPRLISLTVLFTLQFGNNVESLIAVPLPRSLERLHISRNYGPPQNVRLAEAWAGRRFKHLVVQFLPDVDEALRYFVASHNRPWDMEISDSKGVKYTLRVGAPGEPDTLETSAAPVLLDYGPTNVAEAMLRAAEAQQLARLTTLWMSASLFDAFVLAGVQLPAVTALTLDIDPKDFAPRAAALADSSGISVPLLRSFTVTSPVSLIHYHEHWLFGELPLFFRSWLKYDADRLDLLSLGVQLNGRDPVGLDGTSDEDLLRRLNELAACVEIPRVLDYDSNSDA